MLDQAAALAGVGPFTAEQKKMMLDGLNDQRDAYARSARSSCPTPCRLRLSFIRSRRRRPARRRIAFVGAGQQFVLTIPVRSCSEAPANIEDLAFATVA